LVTPANWEDESTGDKLSLLEDEERKRQEQLQVQHELEYDRDMVLEREARIRQIESDVLDVNEIFKELGAMIHVQGEAVDTIEANVEKAAHEVEQGRDQLSLAQEYQKRFRTKLCCLVVILAAVAVVITIVVVLAVKGS